ncbi:hypothetical protein N5J43_16145 [Pseudomonas nicosulfuronedens]|uniref:Uncharacterized protein n=1 Tax=Pseudomonas nicosulfuronedens TaxID=2571105 RepID=A0A5R9QXU6_9PSED|nr:hypothetical protein [Pseudomonas nicosulfuronedens]MDH1012361.1 hypothetical protein [Pseudomonas nicosulfuronedens]MDH1980484.1 hypothetical protein [Pseudomonas nicosulfuronedens]MDH2029296.1 hypothetical protein [Pseudomonas nicosulfuronedens]TLX74198.1 hypothetical protein FAS41_19105 [Pseudomonas nicosulfuronedens]
MSDLQQDNPFQTPAATLQNASTAVTGDPVYRVTAVGIASFFGTPIAGAWIMAQNLRRLGMPERRRQVWFVGTGLLVGLVLLSLIPASFPVAPFNIVAVLTMHEYAKQVTGKALVDHAAQSGAFSSNWRAFGVSLLFLMVIFAIFYGTTFALALAKGSLFFRAVPA